MSENLDARWEAFGRELILERHGHVHRELARAERVAIAASARRRDRALEELAAERLLPHLVEVVELPAVPDAGGEVAV